MKNRATRIAKTIRAQARRKKAKSYKRPRRDDFRQAIREAIDLAELEASK